MTVGKVLHDQFPLQVYAKNGKCQFSFKKPWMLQDFKDLKKPTGRQGEKNKINNKMEENSQSVIICVLSRSCWEMREGNVHLCVTVGVCARVCLRVECGGANGVLIAWQ